MTFSLVARDPDTGRLGVAVATCALAVGRAVPWARSGVGAVATQATTNRAYGARGLALLADGLAPEEALATVRAADPDPSQRQVGMVDGTGRTAAWTGRGCLSACGHVAGDGFSAQGNMLASRSVIPSLVEGYLAAGGEFSERLLTALAAAQEAGGDLRGRQSAALLVVAADRRPDPWDGVLVDLRVDDAKDPVVELGRLLRLQRAYETSDHNALAAEAPDGLRDLHAALAAAQRGDRDTAADALRTLRCRPGWDGWLRRMRSAGKMPGTNSLLD
ncbi:MAG TPA: DUF1028 domain-containing protein [Mycobacteriales bacterium]|nr:DUF1028 domain-containing protein [Mycobacteriales bacterium]